MIIVGYVVLGIVLGGLFATVFLELVTGTPVLQDPRLSDFLFKWQALFAGVLGLLGGTFAVVAALFAARHSERSASRLQQRREEALSEVLLADTRETMKVVRALKLWFDGFDDCSEDAPPYRHFVMGESLVNGWSNFPYIPPSAIQPLFQFTHTMFDVQNKARELPEISPLWRTSPDVHALECAVEDATTAGNTLICALEEQLPEGHGSDGQPAQKRWAGRLFSVGISVIFFGISAAILFFAVDLLETKNAAAWIGLAYPLLILLAVLFFAFATPFLKVAKTTGYFDTRLEEWRLTVRATDVQSSSLFVGILTYAGWFLVAALLLYSVHTITGVLSSRGQLISLVLGLLALIVCAMWPTRGRKLTEIISAVVGLVAIVAPVSFFFYFQGIEKGIPPTVPQFLIWLIPLMVAIIWAKSKLEKLFFRPYFGETQFWMPVTSVWELSSILRQRVRSSVSDSKALAVFLTLLVFVVPDEVISMIPEDVAVMFLDVFESLGDAFPLEQTTLAYFVLAAFVMFASGDFVRQIPDLFPDDFLLIGGLYNALFQALAGITFIVAIAPFFIILFFVGDYLLGPELAIMAGFFTFPAWSQRMFALFSALIIFSLDAKPRQEPEAD